MRLKGPGLDIGSLMGGIMMPPQMPLNTSQPVIEEEKDDGDSVSDIVSVSGESTRDVTVKSGGRKRRSKKNEVTL